MIADKPSTTLKTKEEVHLAMNDIRDKIEEIRDAVAKLYVEPSTGFFANLANEKIVALQVKLSECVWRAGDIKTLFL